MHPSQAKQTAIQRWRGVGCRARSSEVNNICATYILITPRKLKQFSNMSALVHFPLITHGQSHDVRENQIHQNSNISIYDFILIVNFVLHHFITGHSLSTQRGKYNSCLHRPLKSKFGRTKIHAIMLENRKGGDVINYQRNANNLFYDRPTISSIFSS